MRVLTLQTPFPEEEFANMSREDKVERLYAAANETLERRSQKIIEVATPVIKEWVENRGANGRIIVPMTDGKRIFHLRADITEAYNTGCKSIVKEWHKAILLVTIDELWKEHLRELDDLRQSVQNASYEQKDPLVIYKVESFHIFEAMLNNLNQKALAALMRGRFTSPPRNRSPLLRMCRFQEHTVHRPLRPRLLKLPHKKPKLLPHHAVNRKCNRQCLSVLTTTRSTPPQKKACPGKTPNARLWQMPEAAPAKCNRPKPPQG